MSVESLLNLNDAILEFDLTPNRADCLSMLGVAYEVAAILDQPVQLAKPCSNNGGRSCTGFYFRPSGSTRR